MVQERLGILESRLASLLQELHKARERNMALEEKVRQLEAGAAERDQKTSSYDVRLRELSSENQKLLARQEATRLKVEQLLGALNTVPGLGETRPGAQRAKG